ncbi:polysaccharide pyruvyl transferase family protein [Cellulomonas sp. SLBN-39]|uniref:polysaccharide pyruvyl transferase family protein n=1 Tax=Cellulomonas sp. SLBN-39 TaxID=2768446 RepID=UPI00116EDF78|nr:polysaccharide pyruvyl transferase family protein [Cellulomonas sp. SLBN-39]TQL03656.1 polysaccharide pyruvyl transferase WcaK-like protein [Cellulomonas sp. SLBN-39]
MLTPERVHRALRRRWRRTRRALVPRRRPVIGLAGFFGAGNYGDELFLEVFEQYLGADFELRVLASSMKRPYFDGPVRDIVDDVDAIVVGGGDIVQPWAHDSRYFHPAFLEKPVFVVGIGVPQYTGANARRPKAQAIRRHRAFLTHPSVRFLGVRDDQAAAWLRANVSPEIDVRVAPDIVCSLSLPAVDPPEGPPVLGVVTRFRPRRDVPDDYSRLRELAAHAQSEGWRVRHIVLGTGEVGQRDLEDSHRLEVPGKELVHSEDLSVLTRAIGGCTALASMKFHGSVVATMYGIPSLVLVGTNKNRNFMERLGLGALLTNFAAPDLVERFEARPQVPADGLERVRAATDAHMRELVESIKKELGRG